MRPPPVELDGIGGMLTEGGFTEGSKQDASHPETVQLKVVWLYQNQRDISGLPAPLRPVCHLVTCEPLALVNSSQQILVD